MSASRDDGSATIAATISSPFPGVCQPWARGCQTYSGSKQPSRSDTQLRTRSGRVVATFTACPPPQS